MGQGQGAAQKGQGTEREKGKRKVEKRETVNALFLIGKYIKEGNSYARRRWNRTLGTRGRDRMGSRRMCCSWTSFFRQSFWRLEELEELEAELATINSRISEIKKEKK